MVNVTVNNAEVETKGFAQKKIIRDGKEFFVMTKKQVKVVAKNSAMIFEFFSKNKT